MGSLLRSVKKRKKSRRLGEVEMVRHEDYESEVGVYTHSRRPLESRPYSSQEHHRQYSARTWHRARAGAR